jgi:hypothetical protein
MADLLCDILTADKQAEWDRLAEEANASLGLRWDYAAAAQASGARVVRLGALRGGSLAGACSFIVHRRFGCTIWRHPTPLPFAGILMSGGTESLCRDIWESVAPVVQEHCSAAEWLLPPGADVRGALWLGSGWSARPHYNYVSRIEREGGLLAGAENQARRLAKKAEANAALSFHTGAENLPAVLELWRSTATRHSLDAGGLLSRASALAGLPGSVVALVRNGDRPVVGGLFLKDSERVYYALGGSDPRREDEGAAEWFHGRVTDHFLAIRGPFIYDWVGANTASVVQFKKKFRPGLEQGIRLTWRRRGFAWLRGF